MKHNIIRTVALSLIAIVLCFGQINVIQSRAQGKRRIRTAPPPAETRTNPARQPPQEQASPNQKSSQSEEGSLAADAEKLKDLLIQRHTYGMKSISSDGTGRLEEVKLKSVDINTCDFALKKETRITTYLQSGTIGSFYEVPSDSSIALEDLDSKLQPVLHIENNQANGTVYTYLSGTFMVEVRAEGFKSFKGIRYEGRSQTPFKHEHPYLSFYFEDKQTAETVRALFIRLTKQCQGLPLASAETVAPGGIADAQNVKGTDIIDPADVLKGQTAMSVYVATAGIKDIRESALRLGIEAKLRQVGITILPASVPPKYPRLFLSLDALLSRGPEGLLTVYTLRLEFRQLFPVQAPGQKPKFVEATSWETSLFGIMPAIQVMSLPNDADILTTKFIQAWQKANPGKSGSNN